MTMKIGRNDPCPCGSGKKYKACCLNKPVTINPVTKKQRKFTASVISNQPKSIDLMERTYGDMIARGMAEEKPPALPTSEEENKQENQ